MARSCDLGHLLDSSGHQHADPDDDFAHMPAHMAGPARQARALAKLDEEQAQAHRERVLFFGAVLCICEPWFSPRENDADICPVHGQRYISRDGKVIL